MPFFALGLILGAVAAVCILILLVMGFGWVLGGGGPIEDRSEQLAVAIPIITLIGVAWVCKEMFYR